MNRSTGVVIGARVSRERASLDEVEAARLDETDAIDRLLDQPQVSEAYLLQTCHRVEAYVVAPDRRAGERALDAIGLDEDGATVTGHEASLRHLLRVAAGLESAVLGEDQVLGQVRDAFEAAREADGVGPVLREAVTKAIHVGERARTETAINEGVVSLGSAAVHLADAEYGLGGAAALVVGAGEMGTLAAKAFADTGVTDLVVANRTRERAVRVADAAPVPARAVSLDDLPGLVADADVVVSATYSPDPVVDAGALADAGETFCIDLGQPRDVERVDAPGVTVHDLDDLEAVTEATRDRRREAAERVEAMIDEEFDRLIAQFKRKRADEVISTMYESAERLKGREVRKAVSQLEAKGDLTDEQREVVESLADSLVSQLLAAPTRSLRDAAEVDDWETIATALDLFDPSFDGEAPFGAASGGADPPSGVQADAQDED